MSDAKKALVPKLRFPEFRNSGEWNVESLQDVACRVRVRNGTDSQNRVLTNSAEYGVVDQRDYFDKNIADKKNLNNYFVISTGDYVYNPRTSYSAPVGPISKNYIGTGVMSPLYTIFRFYNSENEFFAHYFKSAQWHQYLRQVANVGARHDRMSITTGDFMAMPLPMPEQDEQQKIADCLSSLDELIAAHADKLDALKTHKQGLLQQLFPREGETVPRLRFPEFRDSGKWVSTALSTQATLISGQHLAPDAYSETGEVPYFTGPSDYSNDSSEAWKWTARTANAGRLGDTLITVKGSGVGALLYLLLDEVAMGRQLMAVRPRESSGRFLLYFLSTQQARFEELAFGNLIPGLSRGDILGLKIAVPTLEEQQKIANCLSSLDDRIAAQADRIEALKQHKKGLLQQLFPAMDDIG